MQPGTARRRFQFFGIDKTGPVLGEVMAGAGAFVDFGYRLGNYLAHFLADQKGIMHSSAGQFLPATMQ